MRRPGWHLRKAGLSAVIALAGLCQQSCLTRHLWMGDGKTPELHTVTVPCRITSIAEPASSAGAGLLEVRFHPLAHPIPGNRWGPPEHLERYTADDPGILILQRRRDSLGRNPWRDGTAAERIRSFELDLYNGEHLVRSSMIARVTIAGSVAPRGAGEIVPIGEVRPELRARGGDGDDAAVRNGTMPGGWIDRCLRGFREHRWLDLVEPGDEAREQEQTALAWLGPDGEPLPTERMQDILLVGHRSPGGPSAEQCSLLARVEVAGGKVRYLRVPVSVIVYGDALQMHRDGGRLQFSLTQHWSGELVHPGRAPAGLREVALPMPGATFDYHYSRELHEASIAGTTIRVLLTPVTFVIDFVLSTNETLRGLYHVLTEGRIPEPAKKAGK